MAASLLKLSSFIVLLCFAFLLSSPNENVEAAFCERLSGRFIGNCVDSLECDAMCQTEVEERQLRTRVSSEMALKEQHVKCAISGVRLCSRPSDSIGGENDKEAPSLFIGSDGQKSPAASSEGVGGGGVGGREKEKRQRYDRASHQSTSKDLQECYPGHQPQPNS
ncbi:hypothetical protein K1719_039140 [Acacia pycnantha]|nr:hypothetical protein K1719_039140 [Acacia pycnantha]